MTPALATRSPRLRALLGIAACAGILGMFIAERRWPLRRQTRDGTARNARNLAMGTMCAAVIATLETPATQAMARANQRGARGVAGLMPRPLAPLASFLAMDYGFYLWHVATHLNPFLWRFHRVHHVDPDMDMSTALRFHFVDMVVSLPWRLVQVRVSGITPRTLAAWQNFFTASILFHHANWALPGRWDERLSWLLTTPRMHGIHHSVMKADRDSNWSSGISLWDHLHGTFRALPPPRAITIGVDDSRMMADVPIEPALRAPFTRMTASDGGDRQLGMSRPA